MSNETARFEYVLRLGDNALILGQRLSEWCGHGPFIEEDVGIANTALDLIGRARMLLTYAGEIEGHERSEDDLAFLRGEREFKNFLICELPPGDFAFTTVRQFLTDAYHYLLYDALRHCRDQRLAAIAAKAVKECAYHLRHSADWMRRLGDGTEQSHDRVQAALNELWRYTDEMFRADAVDEAMTAAVATPALESLQGQWNERVHAVLEEATLTIPTDVWQLDGGRQGVHTEHMGYLLAEMQFMQRAYPGLTW